MGDLTGSTSVRLMLSQKPMLTTAAPMVLVLTDMAVDSMATVDTLPTHTPTATDTQLLTATDLTGSTSVKPMLSQRLMPSTAASMVLVLTDMAVDSMAIDTQLLTAMVPTGSTSVRLMLSQRLMPSTPVLTDMDTHLTDTGHTDTGHMLDMLPHTPMATATQLTLTDIIKLFQ